MPNGLSGPVAGVVLAAGLSTRMGRNKLLLEIDGRSLLRRAASSAIEAGLEPVLVVLGHEEERARRELSGLRCTPVHNPDYAQGMNTSLQAGLAAAPAGAAGVVVLLGDMPFVTAEMLRTVAARLRDGGAPLVVSTYGGVVAPPTGYAAALFPELRALAGDGSGKKVVQQHRAEALELAWPAEALADTDLPEDLDQARALLGAAEEAR